MLVYLLREAVDIGFCDFWEILLGLYLGRWRYCLCFGRFYRLYSYLID